MAKWILGLCFSLFLAGSLPAMAQTPTPEEEALQLIQQAKADQVTSLKFEVYDLTALPPEIGQLTQLKSLSFKYLDLTELPPEIGKLTQLESLTLDFTNLTELPPEIGLLTNLKELSLTMVPLTELPPEIGNLVNLEQLSLSNTHLQALPPEVGQLSSLQTLNLYYSDLQALPPEIAQLTALQTLTLSDTQLQWLPPEIGQLSNLQSLMLDNTYVSYLPPEIGQLGQLEQLNLARLQNLTYLPTEIGGLTRLEFLDLSDTSLYLLPPEIGQLSRLVTLRLNNTPLVALPVEIGQLSQLIELHLTNTYIADLPPQIGHLTNLRTLYLGYTNIAELPPELLQLSKLETLNMKNTPMPFISPDLEEWITAHNIRFDWSYIPPTQDGSERIQVVWFIGLGTGTSQEQFEVEERIANEFNQSQDEIELIPYCSCGSITATDILATMIASGEAPDIVGPVSPQAAGAFADHILDLQPLIDSTGYDLSQFPSDSVEMYRTAEGGLWGLPFAFYPGVLYYNADMFDAAGLNYPPTEVGTPYLMPDGTELPWDYDTVRIIGKLLTLDANGHNATDPAFDSTQIVQYGFMHQWQDQRSNWHTFGPALLVDETGQVTINEAWRAQTHWQWESIWQDHITPTNAIVSQLQEPYQNPFSHDILAMNRSMVWFATCCTDELEARWDLAIQPAYQGNYYAPNHHDSFFIPTGSANPEAAFVALQYLIGEAAPELLQLYGAFPARPDLQADALAALAQQFPHVQHWEAIPNSIPLAPLPVHEAWYPNFRGGQDRLREFLMLLEGDTGGTLDVDAELDRLESDLQALVDK